MLILLSPEKFVWNSSSSLLYYLNSPVLSVLEAETATVSLILGFLKIVVGESS